MTVHEDKILIMHFFVHPQTNYSFGYGFVNFVSEEGALQAIKTLNGITLRNKRLKVHNFNPSIIQPYLFINEVHVCN